MSSTLHSLHLLYFFFAVVVSLLPWCAQYTTGIYGLCLVRGKKNCRSFSPLSLSDMLPSWIHLCCCGKEMKKKLSLNPCMHVTFDFIVCISDW